MKKIALVGLASIFLIGLTINYVTASSPEAWATHRKEVISSCIRVSGLRNARSAGEIITFSDDVGYDALLVKGNYPQPHMNNRIGKMLCLFNRRTRKADVSEANQIINKS
ncbi:hypothetical protein [Rivularia sp. UHCC 0363]|uniref:hypothetical protein n=1 Tax=Rivularia sp. UHCC 0363 TaxID=3110244 RepID=UPI002B1F6B01|nr:hypothetical protein [Rivularia sp. UHCC 0363]MEA5593017.1 hypothetical protein [Rivularia sp. UHCC 0363]